MSHIWAILIFTIVLLVLGGIVENRLRQRRMKKIMEKMLPTIDDHLQPHRSYNLVLSHGQKLTNVRFIGISPAYSPVTPYLPFPLCQWLIVEKLDGKRAYVKPHTVRYYEDAGE